VYALQKRLLGLLVVGMLVSIADSGFSQQPPEPSSAPEANPEITISQGERINVTDRGFSIEPPAGWRVYQDYNGAMLYMEPAEKAEDSIYRRNIRIMSFKGPRYIDEMTFQEFGKEIVEKSSKMSNAISDYRLRNQMPIEIDGGHKAGLYYAEFTIDDVPLMQMHILVSSAEHHFLLTFTDLLEHFEQDNSPYLNEAFVALRSVKLKGEPPQRSLYFYWLGAALGGGFLLFLIIRFVRKRRVKRLSEGLDEFAGEDDEIESDDEDKIEVDDEYISGFSRQSQQKKTKRRTPSKAANKSKKAALSDELAEDDQNFAAESDLDPLSDSMALGKKRKKPAKKPSGRLKKPKKAKKDPLLDDDDDLTTDGAGLDGDDGGVATDISDATMIGRKSKKPKAKREGKKRIRIGGKNRQMVIDDEPEDADFAGDLDEGDEDDWNLA
jgi:hypothetical protein